MSNSLIESIQSVEQMLTGQNLVSALASSSTQRLIVGEQTVSKVDEGAVQVLDMTAPDAEARLFRLSARQQNGGQIVLTGTVAVRGLKVGYLDESDQAQFLMCYREGQQVWRGFQNSVHYIPLEMHSPAEGAIEALQNLVKVVFVTAQAPEGRERKSTTIVDLVPPPGPFASRWAAAPKLDRVVFLGENSRCDASKVSFANPNNGGATEVRDKFTSFLDSAMLMMSNLGKATDARERNEIIQGARNLTGFPEGDRTFALRAALAHITPTGAGEISVVQSRNADANPTQVETLPTAGGEGTTEVATEGEEPF